MIQVEIYTRTKDAITCRVFEIDAACTRILIDEDRVYGTVWGFVVDQDGALTQVEGELVMTDPDVIIRA